MRGRMTAAALAAAATCLAASMASAQPLRPPPGLHPVTTLWSVKGPSANCAIGRSLRVTLQPISTRSGAYSQQGELTAEILAPEPMARRVRLKARNCADNTMAALEAAAMLLDEGAPSPSFAFLMETCLRSEHAAAYVGAVTLWLDSECAL